ncbi:MAG: hypothetical protein ABL997_17955 [Planctomycetota bacterium]
MSTTSHRHRQKLLTRTDLAAMAVAEDRIQDWLGNGELECVGDVVSEDGNDEVYAVNADSLRDQLHLLLTQHGRTDVAVDAEIVRALLASSTVDVDGDTGADVLEAAADPSDDDDVILEHGAEEALDATIEDISSAIEDLIETSDKRPANLRDRDGEDETIVLADDLAGGTDIAEQANDADLLDEIAGAPEPMLKAAAPTMQSAPKPTAPLPAEPTNREPARHAAPQQVAAIDLQPLLESMQQIHLALLTLGERPQPQFDSTPIVSALDHGIRSLNQHIAAAGDRTHVRDGLEQLHSAIVAGNATLAASVQALGERLEVAAHAVATRSPIAAKARGFDAATGIAAATIAIGWATSMWFYGSDTRLALSVLVCANLVGCCAMLLRRR